MNRQKRRQADWYKYKRLTGVDAWKSTDTKFDHCNVRSDHIRLQTNNVNLLLRLKNELKTIFILELLLVIKMIEERTTALNDIEVTHELQANCFFNWRF